MRWMFRLFVLVVVLVGGFIAFALIQEYDPPPHEAVGVTCDQPESASLKVGEAFTLVSWNLQFCASRHQQFFYEGGEAVDVPREHQDATIAGIAGALKASGADLMLLQEVDRDSTRTEYVDQLAALLSPIEYSCWTSAPYHRAAWVPTPLFDMLGKVDMHLAIVSKTGLEGAARTQLATLDEAFVRRAFNLKRAILEATVPVEGLEHPLAIAVTHLSAFSHGDGTLAKQVGALRAWIDARAPGQPWILAGDLNLLPPGDDAARLGPSGALYADASNPILALLPTEKEALGDQLDPANRTYLPFAAVEPDRKIDYVFYGGPLEVVEARVLREHSALSDHLPIQVRLRVTHQTGGR